MGIFLRNSDHLGSLVHDMVCFFNFRLSHLAMSLAWATKIVCCSLASSLALPDENECVKSQH